jgi:hypothetical protein
MWRSYPGPAQGANSTPSDEEPIFSRLYGRQDFWRAVMQDNYIREFKDVAEEAIELLGYSLILFAMIELLLIARRIYKARQVAR